MNIEQKKTSLAKFCELKRVNFDFLSMEKKREVIKEYNEIMFGSTIEDWEVEEICERAKSKVVDQETEMPERKTGPKARFPFKEILTGLAMGFMTEAFSKAFGGDEQNEDGSKSKRRIIDSFQREGFDITIEMVDDGEEEPGYEVYMYKKLRRGKYKEVWLPKAENELFTDEFGARDGIDEYFEKRKGKVKRK